MLNSLAHCNLLLFFINFNRGGRGEVAEKTGHRPQ